MVSIVRLPRFGDTMNEGTIVDSKVRTGDQVKRGDIIFDIETDKATVELESPADGYVKRIIVKLGHSYKVGTPLLVLGQKDEQVSEDFYRTLEQAVVPAESAKPQAGQAENISPQVSTPATPAVTGELKLGGAIPVTRLQKLTAQKMLRSKQENPCFYLNVKADVTELATYRAKLNDSSDTKVAYNDFIIKAVATALEKFPVMTGHLEGDKIKLADSIGIGLAISVPRGLVAPIVKEPDKKTVVEIARYSRDLAEKVQNDKLSPEDLEGGCITVSNLGSFGIDSFIPIVVPGQCSILGVGRIKDTCVPEDDTIGAHKLMNLTLAVDHKVANGAYAAQFLDFLKKILEDPANFK